MHLLLNGRPREIDFVVLDCDGVLLDTMAAKVEAFHDWVPHAHREYREAFMAYIMTGFGRSRSEHLRYFYEALVGVPLDSGMLDAELERFAAICEPRCARAGWIDGARAFVCHCRDAGATTYVLSGTPQAPLEAMLRAHGGADLFDRIVGSPPGKSASMAAFLAATGHAAERTLFIGDAAHDAEAAAHVGAHFAYVPSVAARPAGPIATEVTNLLQLIPRLA